MTETRRLVLGLLEVTAVGDDVVRTAELVELELELVVLKEDSAKTAELVVLEELEDGAKMFELVVLEEGTGKMVDGDDEEDAEDFYDIMENRDLFQFNLPSPVDPYGSDGNMQATSSQAGPSSATPSQWQPTLDDDEDTRVEDENITAGQVIRMSKMVVETWKAYFSDADDGSTAQGNEDHMDFDGDADNPGEYPQKDPNMKWKPFASELDWRVAMWAVREDVGQNSLNRLLSIPGVCVRTAISLLVPVLMNIVLCRWLKSWSLASRTYANSS